MTDYPRTPEIDFAALSDVTASVSLRHGRTSWDAARGTLFTEAALVHQGSFTADVPLLLVIDNVSDPSVVPSGFDGRTPAGLPYYEFTSLVNGTTFDLGEQTQSRAIAFLNPTGVQFTFDPIVLAQLNRGPHIVSQPASEVLAGLTYMYDAHAVDPDNDPLTYELLSAPVGMTIAAETGLIQWSPRVEDLGSHSVVLRVADGRGCVDEQQFVVVVRENVANRPPLFVSEPVVDASVAAYFEIVDIPVGDQPAAVAVGDFTGQGPLSLVTANPGNQTVSVAAGQGSTSFGRNVNLGIGDPSPDVWRDFYEPLQIPVGFADPTRTDHDVAGIARGDFNHDGFLDVAASTNENTANPLRSYVVVTLGNGDGTFQPPTKIPLPVTPTASGLLAYDFDGDDQLDLLAVSSHDHQLYFLKGRSDGDFDVPVAAGTTTPGPQTALAADLNGDGLLDVVVSCPGRDEIVILPGLGDGTFDTAVVLSTGDNPMSFSLTDVDNSGSVDLVIGCYHGLRYEVRLNDGTGQFGEPIITPFDIRDIVPGTSPGAPTGFYAADFDEDGFVDLAGDSLGGWFVFFRGDGSGSFEAAIAVENPGDAAFMCRLFTDNDMPDFNGDGRPDLLFAKGFGGDNDLTIGLSRGDGTFDFKYWMASPGPEIIAPSYRTQGARYYSTTFGDFNNDGVLDLVSGALQWAECGGLSLLLGESATVFSGAEWLIDVNDAGGQVGGDGMIVGDFTNDDLIDLLYFTNTFSVRSGNGDGSFGPPQWALPGIAGGTAPVRTADFDQDGTLDLVFVGIGGAFGNYDSGFHVALGHGDGSFSFYGKHITPTGGAYDIQVQDLNEDGLPDLVVGTTVAVYGTVYPRLEVWLNNPAQPASFTQAWSQTLGFTRYTPALLVADVTGDGHQDVICHVLGHTEPNRLYVFAGQGDGSLADPIITDPETTWIDTLASGDLNADGNVDLVAVSSWAYFYVMLGRSDGTFEDPAHYSPGRSLSSMVVADMDRDGILDLVAESTDGPMIYRGKGDGSFFTPQRYAQTATEGGNSIDVADFDRDGMAGRGHLVGTRGGVGRYARLSQREAGTASGCHG